MKNGLNIPQPATKIPTFPSLQEELAWWETQKIHVHVEIKTVGHELQSNPNSRNKPELLAKQLKLRKQFADFESQVIQCRAKISTQEAESIRNRETNMIPLIADLVGIGMQILDELREINRKLPESQSETEDARADVPG